MFGLPSDAGKQEYCLIKVDDGLPLSPKLNASCYWCKAPRATNHLLWNHGIMEKYTVCLKKKMVVCK